MWTGTDEYLDGIWQRWEKAKKIIEQYKDSPVEDIAFLCEYCKMQMEDNEKLEDENTKRFKVINLLQAQRDDYIQYSEWLEKQLNRATKEIKRLGGKTSLEEVAEYKKKQIINYDYNKRYHEKELELGWTHLWRD